MITSKDNAIIKHLVKLREDKAYRNAQNKCLIMGRKIIETVSKKQQIIRTISTNNADIIVTKNLMQKITNIASFNDIIAETSLPKKKPFQGKHFLVLDQIQDPGNLGTLIRTAHGLNWGGVILIKSVDPFNDKALRAAKGSTFFIPIFQKTKTEIEKLNHKLLLADVHGQEVKKTSKASPVCLILSNESQGISDWNNATKITVPMKKDIDSLNVAISGGILMYILKN